MSTGACSAGTTASSAIRSASGAGSESPPARRSSSFVSTRTRRSVVVGPREALATRVVRLRDLNWLGSESLDGGDVATACFARVRSTRPPAPATLLVRNGKAEVHLHRDEIGVAPGQACVLYSSDDAQARVLGGGTIASVVPILMQADAA